MTSPEIERRTGLSGAVALKAPVKVATTVNITLVGEQTINGVAVVDGDRVLVKNQTAGADNGIWIASTGDWQRAPDWDANGDVVEGTQVFVTDGSVSPGVLYYVTTADDIVIGTTSVAFSATNFLAGLTSWDAVAAQGTDVASEASLNLDSVTGPILNLTGTIAVTSITLAVGHLRFIRAAAASSFTASANLIVNGSASVSKTNAANDQLVILGGAAGVVYVASIGSAGITFATIAEDLAGTSTTKAVNPAGMAAVLFKGVNVASAGTLSLPDGGYFHITGTTTITDIDFTTASADGRGAWLEFDGILTLTHNGTTLNLPGAANIVTAAGDRAYVVQDSSDNVHVMTYVRAAYAPTQGLVLLASGDVTAAATLDIVLTAYTGYRGIVFELINFLPATDATALWMRFSTNGGSSYDAAGTDYQYQNNLNSGATNNPSGSTGAAQIILATNVGNVAVEGVSSSVKLVGQTSTVARSRVSHSGAILDTASNVSSIDGAGSRNAAQDTDAVRFLFSSGNIASGSYAVYGLV